MPKLPNSEAAEQDDALMGFPRDGEVVLGEEEEEDDGGEQVDNPPAEEPWKAELATMQAQMATLQTQNQQLQAQLMQRAEPPPNPADQQPDFADLLFTNPNEALRIHGEMVEKRVSDRLYAEFRAFDGRREFWREFYTEYPDLKQAKELADLTLRSNMPALKDLPVDKAMEQLAGLTRARIQSYVPATRSGKRATVEGAGAPLARGNRVQEPKVPSLSDIIRGKHASRRGKAQAA